MMTKKTLTSTARALALLVAANLATAISAAPHVEEGAFTVTLPEGYAPFTKQEQKVSSPEGEINATNWISKAPTGEAVVVTMSRMPATILSPEKMIEGTRDSLLKSLSATLEKEEKNEDATESQLQFRSDAAVFESHLVVADDRLYQLLYIGRSDEQRSAPQVTALFDSFSIASSPDGASEVAPATTTDGAQ